MPNEIAVVSLLSLNQRLRDAVFALVEIVNQSVVKLGYSLTEHLPDQPFLRSEI